MYLLFLKARSSPSFSITPTLRHGPFFGYGSLTYRGRKAFLQLLDGEHPGVKRKRNTSGWEVPQFGRVIVSKTLYTTS